MSTSFAPTSKPMMTFLEAVKQCLRKYGDFGGRATRAEFWWWQVFGWIGGLIAGAIDASISSFPGPEFATFAPFGAIFGLAILLPGLAVQARRLHDIGRTGWWILVWLGIYFLGLLPLVVGGIITIVRIFSSDSGSAGADPGSYIPLIVGGAIMLLVFVAVTIWWIVWLARQGQTGPNRFGPDPRALEEEPNTPAAGAVE